MKLMTHILILFDKDCPLCKQLAELATRRAAPHLTFQSWQSYYDSPEAQAVLAATPAVDPAPRELRAVHAGQLLEGAAAWSVLLEAHPDLQALNWLAQRLGLQSQTSRAMRATAALLRALCPRCPRQSTTVLKANR